MADKDEPVTPTKSASKKSPAKKTASKATASNKKPVMKTDEHVTVEDMHKLLNILRDALTSRDKVVDYLQQQIVLNQEQIEQNKKILAKRGVAYKLLFALLAIGVLAVGFDQHSIVKVFEDDMTNVSDDMDVMLVEMTEMRKAMVAMSKDINSMSSDFSQVSVGVSSIDRSVVSMSHDVKSMSYGVRGMSYDTREMNRSMDTMTPPWSPFR